MAIVLKTISDSKEAQADLARLRESVNNIQSSVDKVSNSFATFTKALTAGLAIYGTIKTIFQYSDALTNLDTKLKVATSSQREFEFALDSVRKIANRSRTDIDSIGSLYSRLSRAGQDFGASQGDIAKATEAIAKAMATSGANAQEASAAVIQLGQALGSGKLAGDELRSILENAPPLAKAIADGLGVSVGKLRALGEAGALSSVQVFKAILSQQDKIEKSFSKVGVTYGQALQNLGSSFIVLFAEVKRAVLGTGGSFAEIINDFANKIFNFAINFRISLLKAKITLLLFITDAVLLFSDLWASLVETGNRIGTLAKQVYANWKPLIQEVAKDLIVFSGIAVTTLSLVFSNILEQISKTDFANNFIQNVYKVFEKTKTILRETFNSVYSGINKIDIMKFFPNLETSLVYLKNWAKSAEQWFYWLYDKVIGRSWIPDLVNKTTEWIGKLNKKPLSLIADFAEKANLSFAGIKITGPFLTGIASLLAFRKTLLSVLGVASALAAIFAGTALLKSGSLEITSDTNKSKTEDLLTKSLNWLKTVAKNTKEAFDKSSVGRTLKQVLGLPDTTPGQMFGVNIDTRPESKVGRGPYRMYEDRGFGHDIINAFPPNWQVPVVAAFTGVFALAIVKAFEAGTTRTVLLSVLTTAAGVLVARTVSPQVIKDTTSKAAFSFLDILEKGITALFSGNVLKDPLGVLSIIAKSALLFKDGREALGKAAIAIGTAPTKAAATVSNILNRNILRGGIAKTNQEIANLPRTLNTALASQQAALASTTRSLANLRDSTGALIGVSRAQAAIQTRNFNAFGTLESRLRVMQGVGNAAALQQAQSNLSNIRNVRRDLVATRDAAAEREKKLSEALKNQGEAFKDGFKNISAGAGGILGGLAGFQLGTEIARGMTGSPEWVKVGTALAISFAGQAIGAGIGLAIAQGILSLAGLIGSTIATGFLLLNPIARGAVLLGAAFYAGYELFKKLPEDWKQGILGSVGRDKETQSAIGTTTADIKGAKTQQAVADAVRLLAEELRGKGIKDPTVALLGSDLGPIQRQQLKTELEKPTEQEIKENLESNKQLKESIKNLIEKLSSIFGSGAASKVNLTRPIEKAIGGWIRGPGTGTSDSIPAMLSNGEFVVNARDAAKNWDILTAINSGKNIRRFANGSQSIPGGSLRAFDNKTLAAAETNLEKFIRQISDKFEDLTLKLKDSSLFKTPELKTPTLPGLTPADSRGPLSKALESSGANLTDTLKNVKISLDKAGFEKVDLTSLQEFSKESPEQLREIVELLDKAGELQSKISLKTTPEFVKNLANKTLKETFGTIAELVERGKIGNAPSQFKTITDESKFKDIKVEDEFQIITKALPDLGLSLETFSNLTDTVKNTLVRNAASLLTEAAKFEQIKIGTIEGGISNLPSDTQLKRKSLETRRKRETETAQELLADIRAPFEQVKTAFEKVGVTLTRDAFNALTDTQVTQLQNLRATVADSLKKLDLPPKDLSTEERTTVETLVQTTLREIQERLRDAAILSLNNFEKAKLSLSKLGVTLDESVFNILTDAQRAQVTSWANNFKKITPDMSESVRIATEKSNQALAKKISDTLQRAPLGKLDLVRLDLSQFGVNIEESLYNRLSGYDRMILDSYISQLKEYKITPEMAEDVRLANQKKIDEILKQIGVFLPKFEPDYKTKGQMAGEAFHSSLMDGFSSAFTGLLKSDFEDNKSVWVTFRDRFLDNLTNTVIDVFSKGIMDPFTGENGIITTTIKKLGSKIFDLGKWITTPSVDLNSGAKALGQVNLGTNMQTEDSSDTDKGLFANLLSSVTSGFATAGGFLSSIVASAAGLFGITFTESISTQAFYGTVIAFLTSLNAGIWAIFTRVSLDNPAFASGGLVSGPGTGKSDSISAMLSNGEFVVNAKATKDNLALLTAINSGDIRRFAEGGLVSTDITSIPSMSAINNSPKNSVGSQQVINVNITGDISRQTRAEIYSMLPKIADGVNHHNREKGYRG